MVQFAEKIPITKIKKMKDGQRVALGGWAEHLVDKGKICFLTVRDASGRIQVTGIKKELSEGTWETLKNLSNEDVIWVIGNVKETEIAPDGIEIVPETITVLNPVQGPTPIDITGRTPMDEGTVFTHRELSIRMDEHKIPLKIKGLVAQATRDFFNTKGFTEFFSPLIVATATEGGATLFPVKYFEQEAYLAQSAQFYKQAAITAHEKVFGIIPSFRMEKSRTRKHVAEFWQIEVEAAFYDHIGMMQILEDFLIFLVNNTIKKGKDLLDSIDANPKPLKPGFPRLTFKECKELLLEIDYPDKVIFTEDFTSPEETALSNHFQTPFFITDWPVHTRGIYYGVNEEDPSISNSFDLMAPGGFVELCTGGQRVHKYEKMVEVIKKQGFDLKSYDWYLNLFKFGIPPHAGFGLGIERLVWWICQLDNIKQGIMFPRTVDILKP
ncbi:MAG: aspartate--tRNA(Asn) ligase [Asgard group archaeon]|nr:aspartate--tRNA(Asn) ligase [Asgard group archaeon]